jgi:hypothetical protein
VHSWCHRCPSPSWVVCCFFGVCLLVWLGTVGPAIDIDCLILILICFWCAFFFYRSYRAALNPTFKHTHTHTSTVDTVERRASHAFLFFSSFDRSLRSAGRNAPPRRPRPLCSGQPTFAARAHLLTKGIDVFNLSASPDLMLCRGILFAFLLVLRSVARSVLWAFGEQRVTHIQRVLSAPCPWLGARGEGGGGSGLRCSRFCVACP